MTYFWESFTAVPLRNPPDLSTRPELTIGDVYCNIVRGQQKSVQLWIWTEENGRRTWQPTTLGIERDSDGRRLALSPKLFPSWVSDKWFRKQDSALTTDCAYLYLRVWSWSWHCSG